MQNPRSQEAGCPNLPAAGLIRDERQWMEAPSDAYDDAGTRIVASRWAGSAAQPRETLTKIDVGHHVVAIALRPMNAALYVGRGLIADGRISQGTIGITKPGESVRAIFRGKYDVLHLHIPNTLIASCLEDVDPDPQAITDLFAECRTMRDPAIERLAHSLIDAGDVGAGFGPTYADSICLAVLVRLLDLRFAAGRALPKRTTSVLTNWRLKRVTDYIEQHLAEPVGLADLAASAGLSRMHFAAQFRAATGMRPHDYLVWRRIEQALALLRDDRYPLCEVALDVGFKTQAHFTTVFKKVVGKTPNEWRHRKADPRPGIAVHAAGARLRNSPSISRPTDNAPRQYAA